MRTSLWLSVVAMLSLSGCWLDDSGGSVSADSTGSEDSQIGGTDAIAGTDTIAGTDASPADTTGACSVGDQSCGAGKFCAAAAGTCSGSGVCKDRPQMCPAIYGPICGCDGKDYGNECEANGAGVVMNKGGSCSAAATKWYTTCGAPVCSGVKVDPNVPKCTTQKEGDACPSGAAECDLQNDCQQHLKCTDKDPKQNPGGCPISRRAFKTDIHYLEQADVAQLQQDLLATKLATYRYRDAGSSAPRQLGFVIDDQPDSPAVDARRDMVDLYGYLSMSVAALQVQHKQLAEQARRIEQLEQALRQAPVCVAPAGQ